MSNYLWVCGVSLVMAGLYGWVEGFCHPRWPHRNVVPRFARRESAWRGMRQCLWYTGIVLVLLGILILIARYDS